MTIAACPGPRRLFHQEMRYMRCQIFYGRGPRRSWRRHSGGSVRSFFAALEKVTYQRHSKFVSVVGVMIMKQCVHRTATETKTE